MTVPNQNPNSPNLDRIGEIMEKLKKGERVELHDIGLDERIRAEKFMEKSKENFNVAIRVGSMKIRVRSGGFEVQIKENNKIEVYGKDGRLLHLYENECLVKNMKALLMGVLAKYGLTINERWIAVSLPRQDHDVRKLQSWVLACITNFSKPLKNNPLICT
jgi:hypothetical protein